MTSERVAGERTVLVVEDNEMNLELTTEVLTRAGLRVIQARDAERGVEMALREQPSLAIFDWGLPGKDGLAAARELRATPETSRIPIIIVSAHAMPGDEERAREAGCDAYVTKPIDTRTLPMIVVALIARPPRG